MSMRKFGLLTTSFAGLLTFGEAASAFPSYLNNFSDHYEENQIEVSELVGEESCGLCHVSKRGGGRRNAYGQDFAAITLGQSAGFNGIEFLDSDDDQFNNLEEIFLQTSPGNDTAAPSGRIDLTVEGGELNLAYGEDCSSLDLVAFGFQFVAADNASSEGASLLSFADELPTTLEITGETGAILAKCSDAGFVGSLLTEQN